MPSAPRAFAFQGFAMPSLVIKTFETRLGDVKVYELTVAEVRDRLRRLEIDDAGANVAPASIANAPEHAAASAAEKLWFEALDSLIRFDDDFTLRDLRDLTTVTEDQLALSPSELKPIIAAAREANGHFFDARSKLDQLLARSIKPMVDGSAIANSLSGISQASSGMGTRTHGIIPTPSSSLHWPTSLSSTNPNDMPPESVDSRLERGELALPESPESVDSRPERGHLNLPV